jgi:hypothetical protein
MQGAARRAQGLTRFGVLARGHPVDAVFLHEAGDDVVDRFVAEEREEMDTQPVAMALHISCVALAHRERPVLANELVGGGLRRRSKYHSSAVASRLSVLVVVR